MKLDLETQQEGLTVWGQIRIALPDGRQVPYGGEFSSTGELDGIEEAAKQTSHPICGQFGAIKALFKRVRRHAGPYARMFQRPTATGRS